LTRFISPHFSLGTPPFLLSILAYEFFVVSLEYCLPLGVVKGLTDLKLEGCIDLLLT